MVELGRDDSKAPFNMAIATLERLSDLLREISKTAGDVMLSPAERQSIMVSKVQHFFFQASPLLPEEIVNKYKEIVINLKPTQIEISNTKYGRTQKKQTKLLYNPELDMHLSNILIVIQRELQKEKYFMPPRKDLSKSVTEMY